MRNATRYLIAALAGAALTVLLLAGLGGLVLGVRNPPATFDEFWCAKASLPADSVSHRGVPLPESPVAFFDYPAAVLACCTRQDAIRTSAHSEMTEAIAEALQLAQSRGAHAFLLSYVRYLDYVDGSGAAEVQGFSYICPFVNTKF